MEEKLKANMILEIMGRPPEHVKESLNTIVVKMGSEKGTNVVDKKYHDPKPIEEKNVKDLFVAFAEVGVEFDSLTHFLSVIMGYMPSNVEVYEPEKFKLNSSDVNEMSNFLMGKLHRYDEMAKRLIGERDILIRQLEYIRRGGKVEDLEKEFRVKNVGKENGEVRKVKDNEGEGVDKKSAGGEEKIEGNENKMDSTKVAS
jgi:hypothetical protein